MPFVLLFFPLGYAWLRELDHIAGNLWHIGYLFYRLDIYQSNLDEEKVCYNDLLKRKDRRLCSWAKMHDVHVFL